MSRTDFIRILVLLCIVSSTACNSSTDDPTLPPSNTEIELLISDPDNPQDELAALVDFVSYRITCIDSGLTPYSDAVDLSGNLELDFTVDPPVWQLLADLPPSPCTITLWVFYDDEVVCSGSQTIPVVENGDPSTANKVDIVLECRLSVDAPSGDADIDGNFTYIHGNYCPQLFWLGAVPSVVDATGVTNVQTSYIDQDNTCGLNCDPQTCDFTQNPPVCSPAPDPGLSSTLFAPAGNGTFGNPNATNTTYTCDPLAPGPTEICVLVSDGDVDCDQQRCVTIECPDLCAGAGCDDGNECTRDFCDPATGVCSNDPAPDGIACNSCDGTCVAGACTGPAYTAAQNGPTMPFIGTLQVVNDTFVNPYSGESFSINATLNVNTSSYRGVGLADSILGTSSGDVLFVHEPLGTQTVCGVEMIQSFAGFDLLFLADEYVVLQGMALEGGITNDVIWANAGDDALQGNSGVDRLDGGPGNDIMDGGEAGDWFTIWPGSGFDSISDTGTSGTDSVQVLAFQSQVLIVPATDPTYEFDIYYLGVPLAEIRDVEQVIMNDTTIDLSTCTGGPADVCNLCGNDALNGNEECDDGNNVDGDGCAADCTVEY
jgi:cysteine-rich repeat protein